jgi:hypothetical protein
MRCSGRDATEESEQQRGVEEKEEKIAIATHS